MECQRLYACFRGLAVQRRDFNGSNFVAISSISQYVSNSDLKVRHLGFLTSGETRKHLHHTIELLGPKMEVAIGISVPGGIEPKIA